MTMGRWRLLNTGPQPGSDVIAIQLVDVSFTKGREFDLGAAAMTDATIPKLFCATFARCMSG